MQKIKVNAILVFFIGLLLLAFGVILAIKAHYGITVVMSTPYVLSMKFTSISLGTFNYLFQGIVFIGLILVMKQVKVSYFLAFLTSVLFGFCIDTINFLLRDYVVLGHFFRITHFVVSILLIGLGLSLLIISKLPLMPFDLFVREVSKKYQIKLGVFKTGFDLTLLIIATTLSLMFFNRLEGIGIGTLVSALTIGYSIHVSMLITTRFLKVNEFKQLKNKTPNS